MKKIEIAKFVVSNVVAACAGSVIASVIKSNTNPETTQEKVTVIVGSFVLGSMVADIAGRYTDVKIDKISALIEESRQK